MSRYNAVLADEQKRIIVNPGETFSAGCKPGHGWLRVLDTARKARFYKLPIADGQLDNSVAAYSQPSRAKLRKEPNRNFIGGVRKAKYVGSTKASLTAMPLLLTTNFFCAVTTSFYSAAVATPERTKEPD